MAALCVGGRMRPARLSASRSARFAAALALVVAVTAPATADEPIVVFIDQATIMRLPDRAATVVVGNPLIADLSVQRSGVAVVTGKSYGATNFIVLDKSGAVLTEKAVEVTGPREKTVVVYRGVTRQTYSCTPDCDPRITLGDTSKSDFDAATGEPTDYFGKTLGQTVSRDTQATAAAAKH